MDFGLTGEQEMLKALVERFVADRYATADRAASRANPGGYAPENWALLAELGVLGMTFAETFDGLGGGDVEIATALEAIGRGLVAEPVLNEIIVAGRLLEDAGTQAQQQAWLPRIIAGTAHLALAHAEHTSRFDLRQVATRFGPDGLTGHKTCVPGAADAFIVTARGPDVPLLCLARADAPGLLRRDYRLVDGSVASELQFDGVAAEPLAAGLDRLDAVLQSARIAASAEMLGLMTLLLDDTLDYVRQRRQFGAPIGSFQAIQHRLADLYVSVELSRSQLYRCVMATPAERPAAIAAAKSFIASHALRLGEECIQLHGGMGVSDELSIGHAHKRILVLASFFGDADHELRRYHLALRAA